MAAVEAALFDPGGVNSVRMFAMLFCIALAAQVAVRFNDQWRYFQTAPERVYGPGPRLLGWLAPPHLSAGQFRAAGVVLIASLAGAAAGFVPTLALAAALVSHFVYFGAIRSLASVQRKTNLSWIVLLILLASSAASRPLDAPAPGWPIVLTKIALAQMYFAAGIQKLRHSGWQWCDGSSLQAYLVEHDLWGDMPLALRLADSPFWCRVVSIGVLFFELTFAVAVFVPVVSWVYVIAALAFHAGTAAIMRIDYSYVAPVYLVFLTPSALRLVHL